MLEQIALGSMLVVITTGVHALCTIGVILALRLTHSNRVASRSVGRRFVFLSALVLSLFLAVLGEVALWAVTYRVSGAITSLEPALYFSMVTFTTLGYGDVTLDANWRLLASLQAGNGTIIFGWTTAIIVAVLHRMVIDRDMTAA
jgi:hypothetical protein